MFLLSFEWLVEYMASFLFSCAAWFALVPSMLIFRLLVPSHAKLQVGGSGLKLASRHFVFFDRLHFIVQGAICDVVTRLGLRPLPVSSKD